MRITITGKNIELTPGLKEAVEERLSKLEKYFTPETEVNVTMSVEKERRKIEVTIPVKGSVIRNKIVTKQQNAEKFFAEDFLSKEYEEDDDEIRIIRSKRFGIKPMYPEEACVQMELLGHNFFVFLNAETEEVNVVYKRKGNTYGLIEPEF